MPKELERVTGFLKELDSLVNFKSPVNLYLIGGAAITLAYDHSNRTADLDFIDPPHVLPEISGMGSKLAEKHGIYLSAVYEINFSVPSDWKKYSKKIDLGLKNIVVYVASVEDIVLGKCARMEPKDTDDIDGLKKLGLLDEKKILERMNQNLEEVKNPDYRNNVMLLFRSAFGKKAVIEKGKVKLV